MIPTFLSRNISPHFACKIKTNESVHVQCAFLSDFASNSPMISPRGNPPLYRTKLLNAYKKKDKVFFEYIYMNR